MIADIHYSEPQFRFTPEPATFDQQELALFQSRLTKKDPAKARDEGIELSKEPVTRDNADLGEWAITQLINKNIPFFARELAAYMGKPKYPRAFAHVVGKARREGRIRIVAWARPTGTDGTLAALWFSTDQGPVKNEMFHRPEIRSYILVPESVGLSAADIQQEFTTEDCEALEHMPTPMAAEEAINRLITNGGYFSAETLAAMLAQTRHAASESRRAICAVIQKAYRANKLEIHDVLPSANATRNKGKVIIYRGATE